MPVTENALEGVGMRSILSGDRLLRALLLSALLMIAGLAFGTSNDDTLQFGKLEWLDSGRGATIHGVSWVRAQSGDVIRSFVDIKDTLAIDAAHSHFQSLSAYRNAIREGRACQHTEYFLYRRGALIPWLEYFENPYGFGFHHNVEESDLEAYPRFKFKAILWTNMLLDIGIFYATSLLLLCSIFTARRYVRVRRGKCVSCGYDLRGSVSGICSECGCPIILREGTT